MVRCRGFRQDKKLYKYTVFSRLNFKRLQSLRPMTEMHTLDEAPWFILLSYRMLGQWVFGVR